MRPLKWLLKWAITFFVAMTFSMLAWTFLWPERAAADLPQADVIMCLGAGMDAGGNLGPAAQTRTARCVDLYNAGRAPIVVFSGGTASDTSPTAGGQMALLAQSLGIPATATVVEGRAQSTLQNALFSLPLAPDATDMIIVTEAFHLPRAWASFRWAAFELGTPQPTLTLVMSEQVRRNAAGDGPNLSALTRESIAIWFNIARAAAFSLHPDAAVDWLH